MPTVQCTKCADRAADYRQRALQRLHQAERTLDILRQRLLATPRTVSIRAQDALPREMNDYLLTVRDLDRILARGQAIATIPDKDHIGHWLTIRLVTTKGETERALHLVLHYEWPPTPLPHPWIVVAAHAFEPDEHYDADGYRLCWCEQPIRPEEVEYAI
jgi:hypothetical protein